MTEYEKAYAIGPGLLEAGDEANRQKCSVDAVKAWLLAIDAFELALRIAPQDEGTRRALQADLAHTRMNMGVALDRDGALSDAIASYRQAEADYAALMNSAGDDGTRRALHSSLARTRMNLGVALDSDGALSDAIASYRQAEADYLALMNSAGDDGTRHALQAELAGTRMNLGVSMSSDGALCDAIASYRLAEADYAALMNSSSDASTRRALQTSLARTRMNLGVSLRRDGALGDAIASYRQAEADYAALMNSAGDGGTRHALQTSLARTRMNLGNALRSDGALSDAIASYRQAEADYAALMNSAGDEGTRRALQADLAGTRMNLGVSLRREGALSDAIASYRRAEADYAALMNSASDAGTRRALQTSLARTRMNLGISLRRDGALSDAIASYRQAEADYAALMNSASDAGTRRALQTSLARTRMNLGVSLRRDGALGDAIASYRQAEADYAALMISASDEGMRRALQASLARTRMNLGISLSRDGAHSDAIAKYRQAEADYSALMNSAGDDGTRRALQASLARTRMNLGVSLRRDGALGDAITSYRQAETDYAALMNSAGDDGTRRELQASLARTRMNMGDAFRSNGAMADAIASYRQAEADYTALMNSASDEGTRRALHADLASTQMNLGVALESDGDQSGATRALEQSTRSFHDLAFAKSADRYAVYVLRYHADFLGAWFQAWKCAAALPQTPWPWLDTSRDLATDKAMLSALGRAAKLCKQVAHGIHANAARNARFRPAVLNLLDLMRRVSLEVAPGEKDVELVAEAQGQLFEAIDIADDPIALAHWLMQSRAIRGQLLALEQLAQHPDDKVREFIAAFQQRANIDREIAGLDGSGEQGGSEHGRGGLFSEAQAKLAQERRAARLEDLRVERNGVTNKIQFLRRELIADGMLPPDTAPNVDKLMRQTQGKSVLVLVRNPDTQRSATVVPLLLHNSTAHFLPGPARALMLAPAALALTGGGRGVMRDAGIAHTDEEIAHKAMEQQVAAFQQSLPAAMRVLAEGLRVVGITEDDGATELLLVPQNDLNKVAWRDVAREYFGMPVRVLPSMPALQRRLEGVAPPPRPRWASLAFDAAGTAHARLRWVPVEQDLSARLWAGSLHKLHTPEWLASDGQGTVTAVMGAGHGHMEQNIAIAGMLIAAPAHAHAAGGEGSAGRYFTARDLRNIHKPDRLWLSVCLLAQTHEKYGEPLGMLAQAMGEHGVDWSAGSLTPVDDMAAALFSLLFQWRLREGYDLADVVGNGRAVDWTIVFDSAKADVRSRRWPVGFAAWLRAELPGALGRAIQGELASAADVRTMRQAFIDWGKAIAPFTFPPLQEVQRFKGDVVWAEQALCGIADEILREVPALLLGAADTLVSFG